MCGGLLWGWVWVAIAKALTGADEKRGSPGLVFVVASSGFVISYLIILGVLEGTSGGDLLPKPEARLAAVAIGIGGALFWSWRYSVSLRKQEKGAAKTKSLQPAPAPKRPEPAKKPRWEPPAPALATTKPMASETTQQSFCDACGAANRPGAKFCKKCGVATPPAS